MTKSLSSALFPLTQSQLGIYFESVKHPEKLIYHFPTLIRLDGVESVDELHEALKKVVKAFPSMSARIVTDDAGNPLWKDCSVSQPIEITIEEMKDSELMNNKQNLVTPFGFDDKPLGTLKIIKTEKGIYLFFDFHHTLFDGYTLKLFLRSLDTALRELKLEGETVSVCELAYREQKERESGKLKECKNNYGTFLEGADTAFDILPDISSPNIIDNDSFSKIRVNLGISTEKYKNFCKENNLPLSVTATSAIGIVVQMLNRRQDVTFATVYHGRKNHDYENTFGMMVKTLPVRVRTEKSTTIKQLLTRVKKDLKTARDNDLYSFVDAAADFGVNSDFLFGFQGDFLDLPDVKREKPVIIPVEMLATGSKITAQMFFIDSECILEIEYRKDIFSEGLMKTLGESFGCILTELMESPADTPVSELSLVEKDKLPELKRLASGGKVKGNDWLTIPQMFRAAAKNYPDHTAVVFRDKKLTYEELDSITDKLANVLHENYGVCQGKVVGVMIERSELMAIYPLAIMKAGGAYMPLDPHFPEERLMFMIEDASVDILLADNEITDNCIPSYVGTTITASILDCLPESSQTSVVETSPDAPMVILYTSGSTGKPKGVILQQKNIVTYIKAYTELTSMTSVDHVGGYAAFGFDAHMMDIYPTLSTGAHTLYIRQ